VSGVSDEVSVAEPVSGVSDVEAKDALALWGSGEVWSPDWTLSVSVPLVFSGATDVEITRFLLPIGVCWMADAMAEPPRARATRAAAAPLIVFNRLRMSVLPLLGVMNNHEATIRRMTRR
jgi:hypothetical protein